MGLLKFHGEIESGYDWDDKPFSNYRFGEYDHILIDTNLSRQTGDTITWKIQMPPKDNFNPKEGREPGLLTFSTTTRWVQFSTLKHQMVST